jgi:hypothetical protein
MRQSWKGEGNRREQRTEIRVQRCE